jgi:glycosyltransferase involved in cell wall biosynthesis
MNILFLYDGIIDPTRGGIERVTTALGTFFEKKGHRVFFLGLKANKQLEDSRQYFTPDSDRFYTKENIRYFWAFLKEKNIAVVINQGGSSPEISKVAYCCGQLHIVLISVIHTAPLGRIKYFSCVYADQFQKIGIKWILPLTNYLVIKNVLLFLYKQKYGGHYKKLCAKSDAVVLQSQKFKDELDFFTGSATNNIYGIANPLSFSLDDAPSKYINKKKELLYVGRIDFSQKRVDLLVRIWEKIYRKYPDWTLRIVGSGKQLKDTIELSKTLKLPRILFEGFQEPQKYYRDSALFCMTSSYESFGIVLVEAMQYGVVPFAFNSFLSVTDIIDNQINGVLIPPFDIDKYAAELERFMREDTLRKQFALKAIEKSKDFNLGKIGAEWETLFENMKSNKKLVNI